MTVTLRIDPPLPCATLRPTADDPRRRCGNGASVAHAQQLGGGEWLLLPICRSCVAAMARNYDAAAEQAKEVQ